MHAPFTFWARMKPGSPPSPIVAKWPFSLSASICCKYSAALLSVSPLRIA